jgi:ferrous iron transport protein B
VFAYAVSFCIYQFGMFFSGNFGLYTLGAVIAAAIVAVAVYLLVRPGYKAKRKNSEEEAKIAEKVN